MINRLTRDGPISIILNKYDIDIFLCPKYHRYGYIGAIAIRKFNPPLHYNVVCFQLYDSLTSSPIINLDYL